MALADPTLPTLPPAAATRPVAPRRGLGLAPLAAGTALQHAELTRLFDRSARHYDRITSAMSLGLGRRYRREALERAGLTRGMDVLDVGCGTGSLARLALDAVGRDGSVVAVDPSAAMLAEARRRGLGDARQGIAEALPAPDAAFDMVVLGYALRHVSDLDQAFREFHRVLRPGGVALILEQTPPASRLGRTIFRTYMGRIVPAMARFLTGSREAQALLDYYWRTIDGCVPPEAVLAALSRAGLASARRHVELGAFSEYTARRPGSIGPPPPGP